MLNIGWGEFLIIGIVALIVIGPKELPGVLRTIGQAMTKLRRMAAEFQGQFQEAMREAEIADLKKEVDELTEKAKGYADFDPIGEVRKDFESTQQQIEGALADKSADPLSTSLETSVEPAEGGRDSEAALAEDFHTAAPAEPVKADATAEPAKPDAGGKPA